MTENSNQIKCPRCGGELEKGFLHAPRGVYWDTKRHKWLAALSSETLISQWTWTSPSVEAWRCWKCRLVIFGY